MRKKMLITGGAGFIASHLVERLHREYEITVFDNFQRNALQYLTPEIRRNIRVIKGDVLNRRQLNRAVSETQIIIHCAAIAGVSCVNQDTARTMKVNLIGTYELLEAMVGKNIEMMIHFSTSEVYGPFVYKAKESGLTTLGQVGEKRWTYAAAKLAAEHLGASYENAFGIPVISVRPFNVYGPRQVGEGAIQQMVDRALENKPITVYNEGTQIRSWCYVEDFVDGMQQILARRKTLKPRVFNLGNPQATITVLGLAERIIALSGSRSKIIHKTYPGAEVEIRVPDITLAKKNLRFNPKTSLDAGLQKSLEWYRGARQK